MMTGMWKQLYLSVGLTHGIPPPTDQTDAETLPELCEVQVGKPLYMIIKV